MSSAQYATNTGVAFPAPKTIPKLPLLDIDKTVFLENFGRRPYTIGHHLSDHPLFALPSLIELSRRLPERNIRYNRGDIPNNQQIYTAPSNDMSIQETIRQIEECGSWMVMRFVEHDPAYRGLMDECLNQIQPLTEAVMPGMSRREGFIFITSPGSVTPFHADPEYNFLLQIRGKKTASLFDVADRSIVSEQTLEDYLTEGPFKGEFKDEFQEKAFVYDLEPGDGLHFPLNWPHWVKNGSEVSISFSITFQSQESERTSSVYRVNRYLRRKGFTPTSYGKHPLRDTAKFCIFRATRRAKSLLSGPREKSPRHY